MVKKASNLKQKHIEFEKNLKRIISRYKSLLPEKGVAGIKRLNCVATIEKWQDSNTYVIQALTNSNVRGLYYAVVSLIKNINRDLIHLVELNFPSLL